MRHLDLFSGIGGFALAARHVGWQTVAFCESDPFCQRVLATHWPGVTCHHDVRKLDGRAYRGTVDVITGGFPCQDISFAGGGAGIEGERSGLWREFSRLIGEVRPRYAIVENTAALVGRGLLRVLGDLAAIGYDAEWHCIPAAVVGAPHERDRVWIVAYPDAAGQPNDEGRTGSAWQVRRQVVTPDIARCWLSKWPPEPAMGRVVHGLSADVDAVAALGNAIVPQVAEEIFRAIDSVCKPGKTL